MSDSEPNSRADSIIKQLKEARFRRGKFGLRALFVAIGLLAGLLALIRATIGFENFFMLVMFFTYGFAPIIAWSAANLLLPWASRTTRTVILIGLVALLAFPLWAFAIWAAGAEPRLIAQIAPPTCFFWAIQIGAIALVRFTLFRQSAK